MQMSHVERVGRAVMRTFYDPLPSNDSRAPIWCLGRRYESTSTSTSTQPQLPRPLSPRPKPSTPDLTTAASPPASAPRPDNTGAAATDDDSWIQTGLDHSERKESPNGEDPAQYGGWPHAFLDDFESRIWMTYRSGFAAIKKSQDPKAAASMTYVMRLQTMAQSVFTSDKGFGCMIRSGQCILANALLELQLGRDWRVTNVEEAAASDAPILSLFADDPRAPFSIHRFVDHGAAVCGKYPGEWFGPSATARCIQDLVHKHPAAGLRVYISGDGADVYEDNLKQAAIDDAGNFQPTLILVGTRLGIDKITPVYWEALKAALQMPQSVGIAGGRPSASHYFVGNQDNDFFFLDPHNTRPLLPYHSSPSNFTQEEMSTCHTRRLRRIEIKEMDPSMLIAFLVKDEADFERWKTGVTGVQGKSIVHISESEPPPRGVEREGAIDEVESFDEREDEEPELV